MERHLLQVLQWAGLDLEEEDSWVWKVGELQTYSANSIYVLSREGVVFCVLQVVEV